MAPLHIGCISPSTQRQTQAPSAELRSAVRKAQTHIIRPMALPTIFFMLPRAAGDANRWLQKNGRHCFGPVIYNENTYHDVWSCKAPLPSVATMAYRDGMLAAAMPS
jgi:hypothetical protein